MPTLSLNKIIEQLNSFSFVNATMLEHTFPTTSFNLYQLYKVSDIQVKLVTEHSTTTQNHLLVAISKPQFNRIPQLAQSTKKVVDAHERLLAKDLDMTFIHYDLYRGSTGIIVSEFANHGDLYGFLNTPRGIQYCTLENVKHLTAQLVLAVEAYHHKNIAHGDIKPDNILVFERDNKFFLKLADHDDNIDVNTLGIARTPRLKKVGTPEYMSPEILYKTAKNRQHVNLKAVDCYALGCTMEFLLSILYKHPHLKTNLRKISAHRPGDAMPNQLIEICHFITSFAQLIDNLKNPSVSKRFTTEEALRSDFFADNHTAVATYINSVITDAKVTLSIDNQLIYRSINKIDDPFYLLPTSIKNIYFEAKRLATCLALFRPAFDSYYQTKNTIFFYHQIKLAANHFHNQTLENAASYPSTKLQTIYDEIHQKLKAEIHKLSVLFDFHLTSTIKQALDQSISQYRKKNANTEKKSISRIGIFSQKPYIKFAYELQSNVSAEADYRNAFKIIQQFIEQVKDPHYDAFKTILLNNLTDVLHITISLLKVRSQDNIVGMTRSPDRKRHLVDNAILPVTNPLLDDTSSLIPKRQRSR